LDQGKRVNSEAFQDYPYPQILLRKLGNLLLQKYKHPQPLFFSLLSLLGLKEQFKVFYLLLGSNRQRDL
jgi:hypothetical protein